MKGWLTVVALAVVLAACSRGSVQVVSGSPQTAAIGSAGAATDLPVGAGEAAELTEGAGASPKSDEKRPSGIRIRSPMTLSNNLLPGASGKDMYLRIQMVQGTYSEDWSPGAYMGTLYEGRFQIVIADDQGTVLSSTRLDAIFKEPLLFTHHFSVAFDDYNGDGVPDFTLGQRANSNGGEYKILTIADDLSIKELPVKGAAYLYISMGEGGSSYSVKLAKTKSGLVSFTYYSQNKGKYLDQSLKWQNGMFVPANG